MPRPPVLLLLLLTAFSAAGCGDGKADGEGDGAPTAYPQACAVSEIDVAKFRTGRPITGLFWGQEVWLTYKTEGETDFGVRSSRSRPEALDLARKLCAAVHGGEDIGTLARKWSNGLGGIADGFVVVPRPEHREAPDARDVALMQTQPGAITPLIEWRGGFWFARRIDEDRGRALGDKLEREASKRARARVIHIHHAGAFPRRHEFDQYGKEQAIARAWSLIKLLQGGADFAELARMNSNDEETRKRGGLLMTKDPITKQPTEWIRWGDRNFSQPLLDVILDTGKPGTLWPQPIVSGQGVDIAFVLERKTGP